MGKGKKMGEESPEPAMGVGVGKRERGMSGQGRWDKWEEREKRKKYI